MADLLFKVFIWYGLILQIGEIDGFRNPRSAPSSRREKDLFVRPKQSCSFRSGHLQRSKRDLKNKYLREMRRNSENVAVNDILSSLFDFKCVVGKVSLQEGVTRPKREYRTNMLFRANKALASDEDVWDGFRTNPQNAATIQVPDDDHEDDGNDTSAEDIRQPKLIAKPAFLLRYFIRNGKKIPVQNDVRDSEKYYARTNKGMHQTGGFRTIQMQYAEETGKEDFETELQKEDAFSLPDGGVRPLFADTMTWVNMKRSK